MALIANGFTDLRHGMNGNRNPLLLADTQCAKAINVVFRGGAPETRPAFDLVSGSNRPSGQFRGCGIWSLESGDRLMIVVDDRVYRVDLPNGDYVPCATLATSVGTCHFTQADRFMILQDSVSDPVVFEENDAGEVVETTHEVSLPKGYFGIYAHGRVHMVPTKVPSTDVSGKPYLVSGDIMEPLNPETVLKYEEGEYLAEGGAHGLPLEMGFIGGLGVLRNAQTGTGLGSVVTFARNGVCAFDFSISRSLWKGQALSQVLFFGAGCRSPWAIAPLNDDLVYRSLDGLRTIRYTAASSAGGSGALSNVAMSLPVDKLMDGDDGALPYASLAVMDNRLFGTVGAAPALDSFDGLVSWDVGAGAYSGVESSAGAYDGLWVGPRGIHRILSWRDGDRQELLVVAGSNYLYRLGRDIVKDAWETPVEARIETKSYNFDDLVTPKTLHYCELWLSDVSVDTEVKIWYRPHGYPLWKELGTKTIPVPAGSLPHARAKIRFSVDFSENNCDPVSGRPLYVATAFQFAIQWTGRATIDVFRAMAEPALEQPPDPCEDGEGAVLAAGAASGETLDDYSYRMGGAS